MRCGAHNGWGDLDCVCDPGSRSRYLRDGETSSDYWAQQPIPPRVEYVYVDRVIVAEPPKQAVEGETPKQVVEEPKEWHISMCLPVRIKRAI